MSVFCNVFTMYNIHTKLEMIVCYNVYYEAQTYHHWFSFHVIMNIHLLNKVLNCTVYISKIWPIVGIKNV